MDPMTIGLLAGGSALANIAGGVLGQQAAAGDRAASREAMEAALAQYTNLTPPQIQDMILQLQSAQLQGEYTPEMLKYMELADVGGYKELAADPRLVQKQNEYLNVLDELSKSGLNAEDEAALRSVRAKTAAQAEAQRKSIEEQMRARGQADSGATLAMQMGAGQNALNRLSEEADREMLMRQQARREALGQASNLAGQLRSSAFNEQLQKSDRLMDVAKFNKQSQMSTEQANVAARNMASQQNLRERQRISEANAALANQQQMHNKGLQQSNFNNQMQLAQARAGAYTGQAANLQNLGNQTAQQYQNIGSGIGSALMGGGMMYNSLNKATPEEDVSKAGTKNQVKIY